MFELIRGYRHDAAAVLCAFDLLELDGKDLRSTPIEELKGILAELLSYPIRIAFNEHYVGNGAIIFEHACALGCEGIVSKRLGSPYRLAVLIAGSSQERGGTSCEAENPRRLGLGDDLHPQ